MTRTISYLAAAVTALLSLDTGAGTAGAGTPTEASEVRTMKVWFGDLDLSTAQDNATLYHRLADAARQVCPRTLQSDLGDDRRSRACQADAIRRAVHVINSPKLARVAVSHGVSNE
jgi:UrcA family protein